VIHFCFPNPYFTRSLTMPNPTPIQLPRHTVPYPRPFPNRTTAEDLFEVLYGHGKLTEREYARFLVARRIFRRICDQLLIYVWLRGGMDDIAPPYRLDDDDGAQGGPNLGADQPADELIETIRRTQAHPTPHKPR
jgi:hypothetical protein